MAATSRAICTIPPRWLASRLRAAESVRLTRRQSHEKVSHPSFGQQLDVIACRLGAHPQRTAIDVKPVEGSTDQPAVLQLHVGFAGIDVDGYDRVSPLPQQQAVAARRRPDVEHSAPT